MSAQEMFVNLVADELAAGRLILPTLPEIALAISQLLSRDDVSAARVAQEIAKDPATTARILAAANTAGMRGAGKPVDTLNQAVTRLGFELTRVLVNRMAMEQLFRARSATLALMMKKSWQRSLQAAALGSVLARRALHLHPETAMLAGLVHLVGVLPIIRLLDDRHRDEHEALHTEESVYRHQAQVGQLVLQRWKLPDELVQVPSLIGRCQRAPDAPADYADVMNLSLVLLGYLKPPEPLERMPAFRKLHVPADLDALKNTPLKGDYDLAMTLLA